MMVAWVLARCYNDIVRKHASSLAVMTAEYDVAEFDFSELPVLSAYIKLVGYSSESIFPSVLIHRKGGTITTFPDRIMFPPSALRQEMMLLKPDNLPFDTKLAMRYGVKALVTDRGRLLYLNTMNKARLLLGEFCSSVNTKAISGGDSTRIYLDDRIEYVELDFYAKGKGGVDISRLHHTDVIQVVIQSSAGKLWSVFKKGEI